MIFPYSTVITGSPAASDFSFVRRPEIPIRVSGAAESGDYLALVDTGSDYTILPKSIADDLGIILDRGPETTVAVFGGRQIPLLAGNVSIDLTNDEEVIRWHTPVCFFEFSARPEECLILGHAGFLEFFTAIFDGEAETLTLLANDRLPAIAASI